MSITVTDCRYQRQQRKDGLLPQRTETLTLSPCRSIKAHHHKCPKLLNHVIAGQLAHTHSKYPPQQKASNIPDHTIALKMPLNSSLTSPSSNNNNNAPLNSTNSELLLNSTRNNYNNYNVNSGALDASAKKHPNAMENSNEHGSSSPDLSNADRYHHHLGELSLVSTTAAGGASTTVADQQKTILLKIPNVSESEQLLVSETKEKLDGASAFHKTSF